MHHMASPVTPLVVLSAQREDGQAGPERHGDCFFHPRHLLFKDPILYVTPPVVIGQCFRDAVVEAHAHPTFAAEMHLTLRTEMP